MRRVRLLIPTTYHPDAGGSRRLGEVFDLSDELGDHWVRGAIAEDATGEALTAPLVPAEPEGTIGLWPDGTPQEYPEGATLDGAVLNGDNALIGTAVDSPSMLEQIGPLKQRRGKH